MYLTLTVGRIDLRQYYRLLSGLEHDGWDVEYDNGHARAFHPDIRTERQARVRLAVLGLPAGRFGMVVDGPLAVV